MITSLLKYFNGNFRRHIIYSFCDIENMSLWQYLHKQFILEDVVNANATMTFSNRFFIS